MSPRFVAGRRVQEGACGNFIPPGFGYEGGICNRPAGHATGMCEERASGGRMVAKGYPPGHEGAAITCIRGSR